MVPHLREIRLRSAMFVAATPRGRSNDERGGAEVGTVVLRRGAGVEEQALLVEKLADGYRVSVAGIALYWIGGAGRTIEVVASDVEADVALAVATHVLAPLVEQLGGTPSLHGSGIALGESAIGFLGPSGSGKSSLAASYGGEGRVLADDSLILQVQPSEILVHPSREPLRLWDDSADHLAPAASRELVLGKIEIAAVEADGPIRLARLYLPELGASRVDIEPIRPRDALVSLASNCHRLDPTDHVLLEREMTFLDSVAARVGVRRLKIPRDFTRISEVHEAIECDLRQS